MDDTSRSDAEKVEPTLATGWHRDEDGGGWRWWSGEAWTAGAPANGTRVDEDDPGAASDPWMLRLIALVVPLVLVVLVVASAFVGGQPSSGGVDFGHQAPGTAVGGAPWNS